MITVASVVSREQVQRETIAALRAGTVPRGESVEQDQGVVQLASAYLAANPVVAQAPTPLEPARPEGGAQPVASLASPAVETVAMMPVRREEEAGVVEGSATDVVRQ